MHSGSLGPLTVALALVSFSPGQGRSTPAAVTPPPGLPSFHHLHLNSPNPDLALDFYTSHFPSTTRTTVAGFPALRTGSVYVLFTRVNTALAPQKTESAYWHFGWHVVDARKRFDMFLLDREQKLLPLYESDRGETVRFSGDSWPGLLTRSQIAEARSRGTRPARGVAGWGFIEGPEGVKIEFVGNLPVERFNHVHMFQEAVYCAERWYQARLHAQPSPGARTGSRRPPQGGDCKVPLGDEPTWPSLEPAGTVRDPAGGVRFGDVELNWYQRPEGRPLASSRGQAIDHVALSVPDFEELVADLQRNGVRILEPPYRFGDARAVLIEGPSREAIELIEQR
jgi:catechol 2,3-dioxygenase-like lactoylglutathione lyase family enzyme